MRYWAELTNTEQSFKDNELLSKHCYLYREIYIRTVNRIAEQLDSKVRAVAFDGIPNHCQIIFHKLEDLNQSNIAPERYMDKNIQSIDEEIEIVAPDTLMEISIHGAKSIEIDFLVNENGTIDQQFEGFIQSLEIGFVDKSTQDTKQNEIEDKNGKS